MAIARTDAQLEEQEQAKLTLEELLEQQEGLISRAQALEPGLTDDMIRARLAAGRWQRVFPGVYASFAGELSLSRRVWAALLYAGSDAVASRETAAMLWGVADEDLDRQLHVTVPGSRYVRHQPGLRIHRSMRAEESRHPAALPPRTTVEETVLDCFETARNLDQAMSVVLRACQRWRTKPERLLQAAAERKRLRWRREFMAALGDAQAGVHNLLERRYFHEVERAHGLPRGERQHVRQVGDRREYDDVRHGGYGVRVELDGRIAHGEEGRFRDMRRDNSGVLVGDVTLRYGWHDVDERACETASQVAAVLAGRGWTGAPRKCGSGCRLVWPPAS